MIAVSNIAKMHPNGQNTQDLNRMMSPAMMADPEGFAGTARGRYPARSEETNENYI